VLFIPAVHVLFIPAVHVLFFTAVYLEHPLFLSPPHARVLLCAFAVEIEQVRHNTCTGRCSVSPRGRGPRRTGPERFENHRRVGGDNRPAFTACSHPNVGHAHSGARAVLPRGRGTHSGQREGRPGGGGDLARPAGACVCGSKVPNRHPLSLSPSAACAVTLCRTSAHPCIIHPHVLRAE
jgi:hypothetical protein